jgi:RecA-family ATPase
MINYDEILTADELAALRAKARKGNGAARHGFEAPFDEGPILEEPADFAAHFGAGAYTQQEPSRTPLPPLNYINLGSFVGKAIPARRFVIPPFVPESVATLLYGDGGLGKSLLGQMAQTAGAVGGEWCGVACEPFSSLGVYCEDDEEELCRRQSRLNQFYGVDAANASLLDNMGVVSRVGHDNFLMTFDRRGMGEKTPFFKQIRERVLDEKRKLLFLDPLVELYGGDEIKRPQVRQFMSAMNALALEMQGGLLLAAHPSASGLSSGNGTSGSTDWSNASRSRAYFSIPKPDDSAEPDEDARVLSLKKANYAKRGETVSLRYHDGVFVVDRDESESASAFRPTSEKVFIDLLDKYTGQNRRVSHIPQASTFAPAVFARDEARKGYRKADFVGAMNRLFDQKKLEIREWGPPSKIVQYLARSGGYADA